MIRYTRASRSNMQLDKISQANIVKMANKEETPKKPYIGGHFPLSQTIGPAPLNPCLLGNS